MKFIRLTRNNGTKAWINFALVTEFGRREEDETAKSWVSLVTNDTSFFKETPFQILELLTEST